ncbi:hypothetical protein [Priestia aryabhattai]|uniref:hypothetical protein n=1 Tax=Priestia aryabhattai TaxID=412384 RepID=UPI0015F6D4C2|nr:hypothetical protein [Priestia aryabhattai]
MIKIVKQDDFEEKKKRHDEQMETDEEYKNRTELLTFKKGHKLMLAIEVTDEFFSHNIMNLLYGHVEGCEMLGFKLNEVVLNPEEKVKDDVKSVLNQVIMNLDQYKNSL